MRFYAFIIGLATQTLSFVYGLYNFTLNDDVEAGMFWVLCAIFIATSNPIPKD